MPYIEFIFTEIDQGHVTVSDGMGAVHYIPEHMVDENYKDWEIGDEVAIFLSNEYCKLNGVYT